MKRKLLFMICLIVFIVSIAGVSAADDSNQTELSMDENDDTLGMMPIPELQELVNNTKDGGVVQLTEDYDVNIGSLEIINRSITINGNNHYIDSHNESIIFHVENSNVVFKNLKFMNWGSSIGTIESSNSTVTLSNCEFVNIYSYSQEVVYSENSALTIDSCKFKDCSSPKKAIVYSNDKNLKVTDTDFINSNSVVDDKKNNEKISKAGALYIAGDNAVVSNCRFINNSGLMAGAVQVDGKKCNIKSCTFSDNKETFPYGATLTLNNFDSAGKIYYTYIKYTDGAGAILWKGDDGVLLNPTLENNVGYKEINWPGENGQFITNPFSFDVPEVTKNYGGSERLEITFTKDGAPFSGANINVNINGVDYPKTTDSNGKVSMAINLKAGTYPVVVSYGDVTANSKVTVNKASTTTSLSTQRNGRGSVTLTAMISPSTATGSVVFNVGIKNYTATISDSKATYKITDLTEGTYNAIATYQGDANHRTSTSTSKSFTLEKFTVDISAPDVTKYYGGSERFEVTLTDTNGDPISGEDVGININGVNYTRTTDAKGKASMALGLPSKVYDVTVSCMGESVQSTVTIKDTVSANDFTKMYKNATQYSGTFVDTNGNRLVNTAIEININGVFYTRTTDDKGVAHMNINLNPGTYVLTATNPATKEKHTTTVTVLGTIVENYDLTKYYKNASQYSLRLLDSKGNPVGAGVEIKLNINGVFYTKTSDANGYVRMNINLIPGIYIITADYNGLKASNTINVLNVLSGKDVNMGYHDGTQYEVKLLDGKGKPYAGQTITININGVFYNKVTGSDGIARLTINLPVGPYTITASYNGLNCANTVKVTPASNPSPAPNTSPNTNTTQPSNTSPDTNTTQNTNTTQPSNTSPDTNTTQNTNTTQDTNTFQVGNYKATVPKTCEVDSFSDDDDETLFYTLDYENGEYVEIELFSESSSVDEYVENVIEDYDAQYCGSYNGWAILDYYNLVIEEEDILRYELAMADGNYFYIIYCDDLNLGKQIAGSFTK